MISKHISDKEGVRSLTAIRLGIDNTPSEEVLVNMKNIAENIFEPLRNWVGSPICINSFYRSPSLNKAIGGSSKSQHCKGQAIDIDDTLGGFSNSIMFNWIQDNLSYDQIIWEFGDENNPDWVHVSFVDKKTNRNRALKAIKEKNKTKYINITNA
jgi:hypothetical protein|tara:strand:- start:3851 stop:4315 length:465 start_codon:yes stop_codon:yes gene_type:complete